MSKRNVSNLNSVGISKLQLLQLSSPTLLLPTKLSVRVSPCFLSVTNRPTTIFASALCPLEIAHTEVFSLVTVHLHTLPYKTSSLFFLPIFHQSLSSLRAQRVQT